MSMKRFGRGAVRIAQELAQHTRLLPRIFQPSYKLDVVVRRVNVPRARNPFFRVMQLIVRNNRAFVRPFVGLSHHRSALLSDSYRFQRFNRFAFKKQIRAVGVVERIRDVFGSNVRYNASLEKDTVPEQLGGYEIGQNIGYGCNAAVYALKLREDTKQAIHQGYSGDPGLAVIPSGSGRSVTVPTVNPFKKHPFALKLMYNYNLDETISDDHLWRSMGTELVPLPKSEEKVRGRMGDFRPLPSIHPNVVKVLTAFVDIMPILPDARERYPEALPTAGIYGYGSLMNEPKTLFVVMKRYRMTLRDYLLTQPSDYWKARVMLGQLMEGVVFLHKNIISQRDMKSDNILLEFDRSDDVPHLVISGFGCALACGNWNVHYRDDCVDLGGNLSTRSPEVILAKPGPSCYVDFSMADTWAAGTLAYEMHTRVNPFYSKLKSATYKEEELPTLPNAVHFVVRNVMKDMLKRDPKKRVHPSVAANAIVLSMFRLGNDLSTLLKEFGLVYISPSALRGAVSNTLKKLSERTERALDDMLMLLTADTVMSRGREERGVSKAELQLRATFLSRLDREELWSSIAYFFDNQNNQKSTTVDADTVPLRKGVVLDENRKCAVSA